MTFAAAAPGVAGLHTLDWVVLTTLFHIESANATVPPEKLNWTFAVQRRLWLDKARRAESGS